jgi:hypothetical protein
MWCSTCQQDVPGLGSPGSGGELRCGKCGANLIGSGQSQVAVSESAENRRHAAATPNENAALESLLHCPQLPEDDWTLEAELRGVQRLLSSLKSRPPADESLVSHLPQMALPGWHAMPAAESIADDELEPPGSTNEPRHTNPAAWTILSLSLAVFACGAVLLAWSLLGQREDLWPVGLPLALIGQAGMILGLVLQIDGLTGRRTAQHRPPARRRATRSRALSADNRDFL